MEEQQNKLTRFWHELKRRKVVAVIIVYATTAFILMQLADLLEESLHLPDWVTSLVTILLITGFPIAIIFSWIFDVSSKGITKTEPEPEKEPTKSNKSANEKSIVVLPFQNMSSDPEQEYFSDGIAEEIINSLTYISELKVIARTSAFSFKNQNVDVREIGQKLDVNYLLEGSVRKAGNTLRITAQLINLADGSHIYSERFDRKLKDIFEIQDEITLQIVDKLKLKLLNNEKEAIQKRYTDNTEAYNLYLLGRYHNYLLTKEDGEKAKDCFESAIKIDASYAPAYVGLGIYYLNQGGVFRNILSNEIAIPSAKKYFLKALKVDPEYAEAHSNLGSIYSVFEFEFKKADYHIKRSFEIEPKNSEVLRYYGIISSLQGKLLEAIKYIEEAIKLDPLMLPAYVNASSYQFWTGNYEQAINYSEKALQINPAFAWANMYLGLSHFQLGSEEKAIDFLQKVTIIPGLAEPYLAYVYASLGRREEAQKVLDVLNDLYEKKLVSASGLAMAYLGLGETQKVFELLEASLKEKIPYSGHTLTIKLDPFWDSIRGHPEFKKILSKIWK